MHRILRAAIPCLVIAGLSCGKSASAPAPAAAPAPAPAAGGGVAQAAGGRGGQAAQGGGQAGGAAAGQVAGARGGGAGGPPRPQLTPEQRAARRDSLTAVRAAQLDILKKEIAGRDSQPAGQVFKNVQINKDTPAVGFLNAMNAYGNALSVGCTFCHVQDKWDDDSRPGKKTARIMLQMVAAINTEQLSKLPPNRTGQTPRIGCTTCHRGNQQPGNALLP